MNYFGTDGIRGDSRDFLIPKLITKIGNSAGNVFLKENIKKVCIGMDPRISSSYISDLLIGALNSQGIDVVFLGVVSTPVVSYTIIKNEDIDTGIMISASHNPYYDNGIKFFGKDGKKISEELEKKIEDNMDEEILVNIDNIGSKRTEDKHVKDYINYCVSLGIDLKGIKIALDCSNGSSYNIAPTIFKKLNAELSVVANEPDGYNINDGVGSTHTDNFCKFVKTGDFDYGFSYDGDADRIIIISGAGEVLDGDYIIYMLAKYFKEENTLKNNAIVSTVMTNLGFKEAISKLDITNYETAVGDKYVMRELDHQDINLGGEQSGHIILSNYLPTGDGILVSVILSKILKEGSVDLSNLELTKYPQVLLNCTCKDKDKVMTNKDLLNKIKDYEDEIKDKGRILVRASGTENLIRVMVEHKDETICKNIASSLVEKVKKI